ncbi:hypothetical protein ES702_03455 [subsurface metagenome]
MGINKKSLENTDLKKQIDITIKLPQYIIDLIKKLGKWSGRTKEEIIIRFIFSELEVLAGDNEELGGYLEHYKQTILDYLHDFDKDLNLGYFKK